MNRISSILSDYRDLEINSLPQDDLLLMAERLKVELQEKLIPVFVINGVSGSGKTTFEKMIQEFAEADNSDTLILSMAADVKEFCIECLGWDGVRDARSRKLLADIISALTTYGEIPKFCIVQAISDYLYTQMPLSAIFIDAREIKDIEWFRKSLGAQPVLVLRNENTGVYNNHADMDAERPYDYDIVIRNGGGLKELRDTAFQFYEKEIKGEEPVWDSL